VRIVKRGLLIGCALLVVSGAPLASGRLLNGVPDDIVAEATGPGGATVSYDADELTCTPPSGSLFPLGLTTVNCIESDSEPAGSFTVTVVDTTPPVVTPPANVTATAGDPSGTTVSYGPASATDLVAGSPPVTCNPASGSNFAPGPTTVTCSATDGAGNTGRATFIVTVTVVDTTPPALVVPGPITAEATGPGGASVSYSASASDAVDPAPTVSCSPPSGATFVLGPTTVSCTARDASNNTSTDTFTVSVVDTTPPTVTAPGNISVNAGVPTGATVTYPSASATDLVSGSLGASCLPASGSNFSVGNTTVTCTSAPDGAGNVGTATFTVTVVLRDLTAPTVTVPAPITANATGPGGASVTFSVSASDTIDPSPTVSCNPSSGATFPLGMTTVSCTATDAANNTSAPATFTIRVVDAGAPTVSVPGSITKEATGPSGAVATFSVTATDAVDPSPTVACSRPSGDTFPLGNTTVLCTAKDAANNTSLAASFVVRVVDTTGPTLQNVSPNLTVEANGPAGSKVNFPTPIAVDLVDGVVAGVSCSPASGSTFALGTHPVTCSAADSRSNAGSASFQVTVADRTPPTLVIPVSLGVHATSPEGISRLNPAISAYLGSASAADIVDPNPVVTNNAAEFLPVGTHDITFTARDASGNSTSRSSAIVVLPQPAPGTPPIAAPPVPKKPDNPANVSAAPGSGTVKLSWSAVPGAKEYLVYRSTSETLRLSAVGHGQLVYRGTARTFTDRGLTNGVEYRYVVVVEDAAGNQSVGVALVVVPRRDLLKSPKNGARLKKAPRLVWTPDAEADYYNAQLLVGGVKVLSAWPTRPQLQLKKTWRFSGRKYTLKPGLYTWYVWPGYGARSAVDYGELLGSRTFRIVRR
jgi:hypothetical protein